MSWTPLFLTPVDVWLFRDGKPFDAGTDHHARSLFPPFPTVTQGAVRSHYLTLKGVDLNDANAVQQAVGTSTDFGSLRLRGPFVARRENGRLVRYFPLPADAVITNSGKAQALTPSPREQGIHTSLDDRLPMLLALPSGMELSKSPENLWLSEQALERYLRGEAVEPTCASMLFTVEHRYGIGIRPGRNRVADAERGLLYAVEFVRLCEDTGLYLEMQGYEGWPDHGIMRIGGEGHGAHFQRTESLPWHNAPNPLPKHFKICFLTPTFFEGGWQPRAWNKFLSGDVHLVAVALRRYEVRGGFDLVARTQKPSKRYVPAGSVYFFEHKGEAHLSLALVNQAITDEAPEIGFGQFWVGEW
ncbi:MAG: type III-B CRISPR module-associated protein Cmr3 [Thermoflexales bacterium]|nr:type III-B CRISPR module-associated protein Cmr3 [Thermoflexales bacterium]MCX7939737.1 type III-B CRISPR module-associated protein Cmr3 [Thermoflexales bacterium]MDW8054377.1 type III-B CRISPR module-associated protein Cmr3 [Anaerolineae bacterium]MDW8292822.1 type III-B CRISPR module-associated protein Cmr3 [Anaerolineae bacterium]